MSGWAAKRFWKQAAVARSGDGYSVLLDDRQVKTPAKALLQVPTRALAQRIADEWNAQEGEVDPTAMPFTRSANAALDKVASQQAEVADLIAAYGDSDLLCYRADSPADLVARQAAAWDPLLDWAARSLNARLIPVQGVMHQPQNAEALDRLTQKVHALDPFSLMALYDLVSMSGSLVLGFAAIHDVKPAAELWRLSRIDETWQEEQWGVDQDASEVAAKKEVDFLHAKAFRDLSRK